MEVPRGVDPLTFPRYPDPEPAPSTTPALAPARTVRIHAHSKENKRRVRVEMLGTDRKYRVVCKSEAPPSPPRRFIFRGWGDCVADVPPGSQLRIALGEIKESHIFSVPSDPGRKLVLEVLPAAPGAEHDGGIVLIVIGGAGMLVGFGALFFGAYAAAYCGCEGSWLTVGGSALVLGGIAVASGIVLFVTRPKEPSVDVVPSEGPPQSYGRTDSFLGDVASAKPRDAATSAPAPFTPLSYGFTF